MNDDLEEIWKEAVMAYPRYCSSVCLEGLKITTEYFSYQGSWCICSYSTCVEHYHCTNLLGGAGDDLVLEKGHNGGET
jgi:hypothetical protein